MNVFVLFKISILHRNDIHRIRQVGLDKEITSLFHCKFYFLIRK